LEKTVVTEYKEVKRNVKPQNSSKRLQPNTTLKNWQRP
jgi:hypothetical protein